jgi:hypothetical protein
MYVQPLARFAAMAGLLYVRVNGDEMAEATSTIRARTMVVVCSPLATADQYPCPSPELARCPSGCCSISRTQ